MAFGRREYPLVNIDEKAVMQQKKLPLYQEWQYTKSLGFIPIARYKR